jgi:predicted dinucleotide-binding enzyme
MNSITLIGTGNMARTIGTLAVAGGNTVEVMGRDQSKADDLATALGDGTTTGKWGAVPAGDIVITALLYDGVVPVVAEYGDALAGKVIVDISNPFNATFDGLAHSEETSIAQEVAKVAPASASVVKAFNTIFRNVLEKGRPNVFSLPFAPDAGGSPTASACSQPSARRPPSPPGPRPRTGSPGASSRRRFAPSRPPAPRISCSTRIAATPSDTPGW